VTHPLYDLIERRRDVRAEFSDDPLDPEVLQRILRAAHAAPSVGNSQPWDFVVVRSRETREAFQRHVATEREAFASSLPPERRERFGRIKIEGILESAVGIVVTYDPQRGGPHVLGRHAIDDAGLYSTCLAIQNLWLAATAEEIGVGWVSFYRPEFLTDLLAIPDPVVPVAWLCVGAVTHVQETPDLVRHGWRQRRPLEDAIHEGRWQG
jgi:5,6-dimethylbenzimidazole synthase